MIFGKGLMVKINLKKNRLGYMKLKTSKSEYLNHRKGIKKHTPGMNFKAYSERLDTLHEYYFPRKN